jgi:hypothetical protein
MSAYLPISNGGQNYIPAAQPVEQAIAGGSGDTEQEFMRLAFKVLPITGPVACCVAWLVCNFVRKLSSLPYPLAKLWRTTKPRKLPSPLMSLAGVSDPSRENSHMAPRDASCFVPRPMAN